MSKWKIDSNENILIYAKKDINPKNIELIGIGDLKIHPKKLDMISIDNEKNKKISNL